MPRQAQQHRRWLRSQDDSTTARGRPRRTARSLAARFKPFDYVRWGIALCISLIPLAPPLVAFLSGLLPGVEKGAACFGALLGAW